MNAENYYFYALKKNCERSRQAVNSAQAHASHSSHSSKQNNYINYKLLIRFGQMCARTAYVQHNVIIFFFPFRVCARVCELFI